MINNNPIKVSVVVPVYNVERYLAQCLDSICAQTLRELEIICVDDQSPDSSYAILADYAQHDERIRIIRQQNRGLGGARNTGLRAATGRYVAFIDSDDWLNPEYFERLYAAAIGTGADITTANVVKVRKNRLKKLVTNHSEESTCRVGEKMRLCNCPPNFNSTNKLFRLDFLRQLELFFPEQKAYEDVYFIIRALYFSSVLTTALGATYWYRVHGKSITKSTQTPRKQREKYESHRDLLAFADSHSIPIADRYRTITRRTWGIGGVTLLKLKESDTKLIYKLLDLIPIYTQTIKR